MTQGNRVYPRENGLWLQPCEYGIDPRDGIWYARTPNGHWGNLSNHDVIEHEDGTITVSPSILVSNEKEMLWHGYLERGVWREV